jgi:hypothetical protein
LFEIKLTKSKYYSIILAMKPINFKKEMMVKRANREVIVNIGMFLLNQENLKGLFWNVAKIEFNPITKSLKIGITTTNNKLGTTLNKLRKNCKPLSDYLYESGALHCRARIYFSMHKEDEDMARILEILDSVNQI